MQAYKKNFIDEMEKGIKMLFNNSKIRRLLFSFFYFYFYF